MVIPIVPNALLLLTSLEAFGCLPLLLADYLRDPLCELLFELLAGRPIFTEFYSELRYIY